MDPIRIESTVPAEKIHHIIEEIPIKKDVNINYEEYANRFRYIFSLNKEKIDSDYFLLDMITKFVKDIIIKFYLDDIICSELDKKLGILDEKIKLEVINDIKKVLNTEKTFLREEENIQNELLDYFMEYKVLIIDGYLKFRSSNFEDLVRKAIEIVLKDFQFELEYKEFIDTLKLFMYNQDSEIDLVNIVFKNGNYILMDPFFNQINNEDISMILENIYDDEINDTDILLSTIVALNPRNVILHRKENTSQELDFILKKIFGDKMRICNGCQYCDN